MGGTTEGGKAAYEKNIARDPDHYHKIGKLSHQAWIRNGRKPRGFSVMDKQKLSEVARKGGESKRKGRHDRQIHL